MFQMLNHFLDRLDRDFLDLDFVDLDFVDLDFLERLFGFLVGFWDPALVAYT